MAKHRDKDVDCNESSDNDDFEKPLKKKKTTKKNENPITTKESAEKCKNKINKSDSTKLFRANFGPLHDLFRDLEKNGQLLTKEMVKLLGRHHSISKEEICKSNHGLEMLVHTFTKTEDGQYGFRLIDGPEVFISTPEDVAVNLGLQMIENGIERKLINERKVTPGTNDLCKRYKFGETSPPVVRSTEVQVAILDALKNGRVEDFVRLVVFYMCQTIFFTKTGNFSLPCNYLIYVKSLDVINVIAWPHLIHNSMMESIESSKGDVRRITGCCFHLLYWFAERSSLVTRRVGAETIFPRFARWDAWNISNAIPVLEKFPYKLSEAEIFKFGHNLTIPLDDAERNLINPIKQQSRLETEQKKVMNLEKENIALIIEKEEGINTIRGILGRFRSERNRLIAKSIRLKVDVKPEIYQVMEGTLDEIYKSLTENSKECEQVHEHIEVRQGMEAPHEEYDIGPDEYGSKSPDRATFVPRTETDGDTAEDGTGFFSIGLTQYFNEQETKGDDVANFDKPGKGQRIKKNIEVHVSSLVRGVKTRSKRLEKGVGADFTPDGLRKKKESKHVEKESTLQYKQFEKLKLYHHMKIGDKEALQSFFKRTTPSDFAWRLFDDDGGVSLSVLGMHVEDLVDNCFLEGELLEYYMYKLDSKQKEEESQMQDSQAPVKYSKSAFMKPGALNYLQTNDEDGVNEYIRDFILRIPDDSHTGRFSTSTSLITVGSTTTPCQIITPKNHARTLRNS
ncbi:hypothetical protein MKW92_010694 [Papaver armeniacum]|nr:hypothetical protein MKW92_010694 [Papaver armeniacum]